MYHPYHDYADIHSHYYDPEIASLYHHRAPRVPISSKFSADFTEQTFNRGNTRLVDEAVYDDMSVERNIFDKQVDEIEKIEGTLAMGHDGVTDLFMDRFSTVINHDRSAQRDIPSEYYIYQHYEEYPSGYHTDHLYTPDHDGEHLVDHDLNVDHHEEHPVDHHVDPHYIDHTVDHYADAHYYGGQHVVDTPYMDHPYPGYLVDAPHQEHYQTYEHEPYHPTVYSHIPEHRPHNVHAPEHDLYNPHHDQHHSHDMLVHDTESALQHDLLAYDTEAALLHRQMAFDTEQAIAESPNHHYKPVFYNY